MRRDWSKINKHSILADRVLLQAFSDDYTKHFGTLNIGCKRCINTAYYKMINLKPRKMDKLIYRLKAKYEGIFFQGQPIRNGDLTEKKAIKLLLEHPHGVNLFDRLPDNYREVLEAGAPEDRSTLPDSELKLKELRERYPDVKANSIASFLAKVNQLRDQGKLPGEVKEE